jgi:hypothetical protein
MKEFDYNLWEVDGVVKVAAYEVIGRGGIYNGKIDTQNPFFVEVLGTAMIDGFAEALEITDWAGTDLWFTEKEWHALTSPIFSKVFGLPLGIFG